MSEDTNKLIHEYLLEQERARLDRDKNGKYTKSGLRHLIKSAQIQLMLSNMTTGEISEQHKATAENIIRDTYNKMIDLGMIQLSVPTQPFPEEQNTREIEPAASTNNETFDDGTGDPRAELNQLIGLTSAKKTIKDILDNMEVDRMRESHNLPTRPISLHMVFTGNPGTGKTTVARLVARIYEQMGVLPSGHLVETKRSGLVATHVGQTGPKTQAVIESALGGVLFIDEAYSLYKPDGGVDFGEEAIAELLTGMENNQGKFAVIAAGYSDEMSVFINSNPGLMSRFLHYVNFEDYSPEELLQIFKYKARKAKDTLTPNAERVLRAVLVEKSKDPSFGNARGVRNIYEKASMARSARIMAQKCAGIEITDNILTTFEKEDILAAIAKQ